MNHGPQHGDFTSWGPPPDARSVDEVLAAFSRAFDIPVDAVDVRPQRSAGRATIFLVEAPFPSGGRSRWVVKESHTSYVQVDVESPVGADQEFLALTRLHAHFKRAGGQVRVPEPLALLPEIGAIAMEYVPGRSLRDLVRYANLYQPGPLLRGIARAADFIRHVHDLENLPPLPVNLRIEGERVLSVATERLRPHGLSLPRHVTQTLSAIPPVMVDSRQVWLHGDFCPGNIMLAEDGSTVGIDPSLTDVGSPEEDLARFIAVMSGHIRFAPGVVAPPVNWIRRRLQSQLLANYYGSSMYPPLLELKLIEQFSGRYRRLRTVGQRNDPRWVRPIRLRAVDAQIRMLMEESSRRLALAIDEIRHRRQT